jgi:glycosyltransferase involved in cell wall biosynthesis
MKILIVSEGYHKTKDDLNGIFEFDQAKALKDIGHDIIFASIDFRSIRRKRKLGLYWDTKDGINILNYSIPLGRFPLRINLFIGRLAIMRMYKTILKKYGNPDIIHANFNTIGNIATVLKEKYNLPLIITEHSSTINNLILPKEILRLGNETYHKADCMISVSSRIANMLKYHWDIDSKIIPNIVDTSLFKHYTKRESENFTFLSIGHLNHNKGFDLLIKSFKNANFANNVFLKIVGKGELQLDLEKEITNNGLSQQIQLMGFLDRKEIANLMSECNAFVLASRGETFGVVYIEALTAGLPVIATKCGGPEDFITKENGIIIPVDNVDSLTNAMLQMYETYKYYNNEMISKDSRQRFSPNTIALQLSEVYTTTLKYNLSK